MPGHELCRVGHQISRQVAHILRQPNPPPGDKLVPGLSCIVWILEVAGHFDRARRQVYIVAVGLKVKDRLFVGGEEIAL